MRNFIITILTSFLFFACGEKSAKELTTKDTEVKLESSDSDFQPDNDLIIATKKLESYLNLQETFGISGIKKLSNYPSSDSDTVQCIKWNLSENQIKNIIKDSRLMNGPDWHYLFGHYPCVVSGQLNQKNQTFEFNINAGSWLTIKLPDTIIHFGYFDQTYRHLFLDGPMTEEDEE